MKDRSSTDLFTIVRDSIRLQTGSKARDALTELEERWFSGRTRVNEDSRILARLARVEEDLAAFKRAHDEHRHTTLGDVTVGTSVPCWSKAGSVDYMRTSGPCKHQWVSKLTNSCGHCGAPMVEFVPDSTTQRTATELVGKSVDQLRAEAENRAWSSIQKWIEAQKLAHDLRLTPYSKSEAYYAAIWSTGAYVRAVILIGNANHFPFNGRQPNGQPGIVHAMIDHGARAIFCSQEWFGALPKVPA